MADFIPVGRTSLARRGTTALQVQTEYAARPYPRIATTITENGRVVHKVERALDSAISSAEEQRATEAQMRQQHASVIAAIEGRVDSPSEEAALRPPKSGLPGIVSSDDEITKPPKSFVGEESQSTMDEEPTIITTRDALSRQPGSSSEPAHATLSLSSDSPLVINAFSKLKPTVYEEEEIPSAFRTSLRELVSPVEDTITMHRASDPQLPLTLADRLRQVNGVQRLIELDGNGKFVDDEKTTAQFRKLFAPVLKNLRSLLTFFVKLQDGTRERGFYAIDPGRLYLVSTGESFFFVVVYDGGKPEDVERRLREVM